MAAAAARLRELLAGPLTAAQRVEAAALVGELADLAAVEARRRAGLQRRQIPAAQRSVERAQVEALLGKFRALKLGNSSTAARPWITRKSGLPEWRIRQYLAELNRAVYTSRPKAVAGSPQLPE